MRDSYYSGGDFGEGAATSAALGLVGRVLRVCLRLLAFVIGLPIAIGRAAAVRGAPRGVRRPRVSPLAIGMALLVGLFALRFVGAPLANAVERLRGGASRETGRAADRRLLQSELQRFSDALVAASRGTGRVVERMPAGFGSDPRVHMRYSSDRRGWVAEARTDSGERCTMRTVVLGTSRARELISCSSGG